MPRYIIERQFAEQLIPTKEGVESVNLINDQELAAPKQTVATPAVIVMSLYSSIKS